VLAAAFFVYGFLTVFMTVNALRRPSPPRSKFPALWLPAVLVAEAPLAWLVIRLLVSGTAWLLGLTANPVGRAGLWLVGLSLLLLPILIIRSERSAADLGKQRAPIRWWEALTSWPYRLPREVERQTEVEYAAGLTLDLYRSITRPGPSPCVVYLHGGSWAGGDPRRQFRPITHYLARQGWVVLAIRYPLSPQATFPDHLTGAAQVFDWIEQNALDLEIDTDRIAVAGGSAGAHLASLAALGGEKRIKAAILLYGVYDFFNRHQHRADWPVIPTRVMKATALSDPHRYRLASPVDLVHAEAPPFLLIHGDYDSLVPLAESKYFASRLAEAGGPVEMVEVRWGQHAFDVLNGPRSRALACVIEDFLNRSVP
jgi:acetyl esterase/lipase